MDIKDMGAMTITEGEGRKELDIYINSSYCTLLLDDGDGNPTNKIELTKRNIKDLIRALREILRRGIVK